MDNRVEASAVLLAVQDLANPPTKLPEESQNAS